jgi:hypothetical protein
MLALAASLGGLLFALRRRRCRTVSRGRASN